MERTHGTIDPKERLDAFKLRKLARLDGRATLDFNFPDERVTVHLVYVSNYFGGHRIYFNCPDCLRAVRYLYITGRRTLACSDCAMLNYLSQQRTRKR